MKFRIREGRINVILFEDYGDHNFALIIDWQEKEPRFKIVEDLRDPIEELFGQPVTLRGISTRRTVGGLTETKVWGSFLKKLKIYEPDSLTKVKQIVAKLKEVEGGSKKK